MLLLYELILLALFDRDQKQSEVFLGLGFWIYEFNKIPESNIHMGF